MIGPDTFPKKGAIRPIPRTVTISPGSIRLVHQDSFGFPGKIKLKVLEPRTSSTEPLPKSFLKAPVPPDTAKLYKPVSGGVYPPETVLWSFKVRLPLALESVSEPWTWLLAMNPVPWSEPLIFTEPRPARLPTP